MCKIFVNNIKIVPSLFRHIASLLSFYVDILQKIAYSWVAPLYTLAKTYSEVIFYGNTYP